MSRVHVSLISHEQDFAPQWEDLLKRAPANVFMGPAALRAVFAAKFAKLLVLLAWETGAHPEKLVGVWALQKRNVAGNGPAFLAAPPYDYSFLSNPVIDPAFLDDAMPAFFDAIAKDRTLPDVIRLNYLDGDCPSYAAIEKALGERKSQVLRLGARRRPFVTKDFGWKSSGSTRKKLRQHWNRLSKLGAVDIVNERTHAAAMAGFGVFLAMEAASWKGARGTALQNSKTDATFAKAFLSNLAAEGNASVALLRVDGRPIAAQVLLYCASTAYTWKIAFDAAYGEYSPGALLVDKLTERLLSGGAVDSIESCSPLGGFLSQLWDGQRATVDMLVNIAAKSSLNFVLVGAIERGYLQLRELRSKMGARAS